jgi:L-threonylcarbamoyladenylate synthase
MSCCPIGTDVSHAAALLRDGKLVAFATETVYGLGANALDERAVAHIFEAKNRPRFDPLIVHVPSIDDIDELVTSFSAEARQLADRFWPGPLTLVLPKSEIVPDLVTAGLETVAIRIPEHPQAIDLLQQAGVPVAAPSANPFGCVSPTRSAHVAEQLGERIDYILDGGACRVGVESTVLQMVNGKPLLLRPGGLPIEDIKEIVGPISIPDPEAHPSTQAQPAPGMLPRHYAPRTPLTITRDLQPHIERCGLMSFGPVDESVSSQFAVVEVLSATSDLTEAAAHFFAALRRLDASGVDRIFASPFPETGLGRALNDRLGRATE